MYPVLDRVSILFVDVLSTYLDTHVKDNGGPVGSYDCFSFDSGRVRLNNVQYCGSFTVSSVNTPGLLPRT